MSRMSKQNSLKGSKFDPSTWEANKDLDHKPFQGKAKVRPAKYDRFLDLHFCANNGWDDFAANIDAQGAYQERSYSLPSEGSQVLSLLLPEWPTRACIIQARPVSQKDLPKMGVVHYAVKRCDVFNIANSNGGVSSRESLQLLIQWVCGGTCGKIRLNSHGLPGGIIHMHDGPPLNKKDTLDAADFARFLIACGFKNDKAMTICLCCCYGASDKQTGGGVIANSLSAIKKVAQVLTENQITGVDVTGSDRETVILDDDQIQNVDWKDLGNVTPHQLIIQIRESVPRNMMIAIRSKLQPSYKQLFDDVVSKGEDPGKTDVRLLRSLWADIQRVRERTSYETPKLFLGSHQLDPANRLKNRESALYNYDVRFPKGATAGQWGTYVRNPETGITSWVRIRDATSHKLKVTS